MKLYFICLFILLNIVTVNANSIIQNKSFDGITYRCDYSSSTTSSNELTPFSDTTGIFKVLWPSRRTSVTQPGIIAISTALAPFSTTNSLKQFTSTKRGFLYATAPASMSVTITEATPLNQKVLMEANYLFTENKFDKTIFSTNLPFKVTVASNGFIDVSSGDINAYANIPWKINNWYHIALLADTINSTISVYINGEEVIENWYSDILGKTINQINLSKINGTIYALDSDKSTVFIDDVRVTSGDNITYDVSNANANILSATFYEIDNFALKIKQVPEATAAANFKSNIKLAQDTTLNVYDENGLLLSDISEITETTTAVVTAPNGVTKKMYSLGIIPSPKFRVDGQIIKNITDAYGKTLNASVDVINDGAEYPLMAILAIYDINGKLITSSVSTQKKAQIGTTSFATSINVETPYKAKFMLWNALQPIREVYILN